VDTYFWANALIFFLPQLGALGIVRLVGRANLSTLVGFAFGLAAYLLAVSRLPVEEAKGGLAILIIYLLGIPGGVLGSLAIAGWAGRWTSLGLAKTASIVAALSFVAMAASSAVLFGFIALRH
jgi:hypothetical protein